MLRTFVRTQQRRAASVIFPFRNHAPFFSYADHILCVDALHQRAMRDRKTKIVCTIGPKSASRDSINSLLHAGMNVLRLNCSHGDHDFYRDVIGTLQDCLDDVRHSHHIDFSDGAREDTCAVALDTKGPEVRTGVYKEDVIASSACKNTALREVRIERGSEVEIHSDPDMECEQTPQNIWCDYPNLPILAKPGSKIFINS